MSEGEHSWDRQLSETPSAYQKFCAFRDMVSLDNPLAKRTLGKFAEQVGVSRNHAKQLSHRHGWTQRCRDYDAHISELIREQNEAEIIKMRKTHASIATQMVVKGARRLLSLQDDELNASDVVKLIETGIKIERLSRGEATESQKVVSETKVTHQGEISIQQLKYGELTDKELDDLERIIEKVYKPD